MSSCFSMGRYIAQQVAAEQRDAVTRRVRDMFPEINLPPAPAPAPAHASSSPPAPARIKGKPDILEAARSGDLSLVRDHVAADPSCVGRRDGT